LLGPAVVKGKGRPKGALGKIKGSSVSSTRRDLSLFEHVKAAENNNAPPPSTAPARLQRGKKRAVIALNEELEVPLSTTAVAVLRGAKSKWDTRENNELAELSTTALAILQGAGTIVDLYKAGTAWEKAYIRSIKIDKLGSAVLEDEDEEGFVDIDIIVPEDPKTQEVYK